MVQERVKTRPCRRPVGRRLGGDDASPGRSCDLGANQEVGMFHGRMEPGIRAGTPLSAAAASSRNGGEGTEGTVGSKVRKSPVSFFFQFLI